GRRTNGLRAAGTWSAAALKPRAAESGKGGQVVPGILGHERGPERLAIIMMVVERGRAVAACAVAVGAVLVVAHVVMFQKLREPANTENLLDEWTRSDHV